MLDLLAVELVPYFRKLAENELRYLDEFERTRGQQ
jgi:hypothetical protein